MNKNLAIACLALFLASASAQNGTATAAAGTGTSLSYCLTNADCAQSQGFCCSYFDTTGSFYTQFNCAKHVNGTASVGTQTCLKNGTAAVGNTTAAVPAETYTTKCTGTDKTCVNTVSKFAACGNSLATSAFALGKDAECTSSSAMSLAASALFAVFAALALLF